MVEYKAPEVDLAAFNCPHCSAYSFQEWFDTKINRPKETSAVHFHRVKISKCIACSDYAIWYLFYISTNTSTSNSIDTTPAIPQTTTTGPAYVSIYRIIYPKNSLSMLPAEDLPGEIKTIYEEASNILNDSPRGAAALLRLGLQKLMPHLGQKGDYLNEDIAELVKQGLDPTIQKMLDSLRVIGNNAVHPGQIDLEDDADTATKLFKLLNTIVELTITRKKFVEEIYDELPEEAKESIRKRDEKNEEKK